MIVRLKEFIKEQLVSVPIISRSPQSAAPPPPSAPPTVPSDDPGALLAGLL